MAVPLQYVRRQKPATTRLARWDPLGQYFAQTPVQAPRLTTYKCYGTLEIREASSLVKFIRFLTRRLQIFRLEGMTHFRGEMPYSVEKLDKGDEVYGVLVSLQDSTVATRGTR